MTTHAQTHPHAPTSADHGSSGLGRAFNRILATPHDPAATILRITLAVVMFPHGAQKALGWFGGYGWSGTMGYFTGQAGLPAPVAALVILVEFLGPLLLLAGLLTRPVALAFVGLMIGAVTVGGHLQHGFFMNWLGNQGGEGVEYHLLVVGIAVALVLRGAGAWSLDRRLTR
ncbi:MAG TPA: DoxX family protein [Planctomycetota bacterium]|nr:DoxX family protein [Planctomycetota bacterium]